MQAMDVLGIMIAADPLTRKLIATIDKEIFQKDYNQQQHHASKQRASG